MKRNRSTGLVWPLMVSAVCWRVVRLKTCIGGESGVHKSARGSEEGSERETHPDAILPCGGDNLAAVELEAGDGVLVADGVGDGASTKVPDL